MVPSPWFRTQMEPAPCLRKRVDPTAFSLTTLSVAGSTRTSVPPVLELTQMENGVEVAMEAAKSRNPYKHWAV
jgi:hypothetical protein